MSSYTLFTSIEERTTSPVQNHLAEKFTFDSLERFEKFAKLLPLPENNFWLLIRKSDGEIVRSSQGYKSAMKGYAELFGDDPLAVHDILCDLCKEIDDLPGFSFPAPKRTTWEVKYETTAPGLHFPDIYRGLEVRAIATRINTEGLRLEEFTFAGLSVLDCRKLDRYTVHGWSNGCVTQMVKQANPKPAQHYSKAAEGKETLMERFERDLIPILARMTKYDTKPMFATPLTLTLEHPLCGMYLPDLLYRAEYAGGATFNTETRMMELPETLLESAAALTLQEVPLDKVLVAEEKHYSRTSRSYRIDIEASLAELATEGIHNAHQLLAALMQRYNNGTASCSFLCRARYRIAALDAATRGIDHELRLSHLCDLDAALEQAGYRHWSVEDLHAASCETRYTESPAITAEDAEDRDAIGSEEWCRKELARRLPELGGEKVLFSHGKNALHVAYRITSHQCGIETCLLLAPPERDFAHVIATIQSARNYDLLPDFYHIASPLALDCAKDPRGRCWAGRGSTSQLMGENDLAWHMMRWIGIDTYKAWVADHPGEETAFLDEAINARVQRVRALLEEIASSAIDAYAPQLKTFHEEAAAVARGDRESCVASFPAEPFERFIKDEIYAMKHDLGSGHDLCYRIESGRRTTKLTCMIADNRYGEKMEAA